MSIVICIEKVLPYNNNNKIRDIYVNFINLHLDSKINKYVKHIYFLYINMFNIYISYV